MAMHSGYFCQVLRDMKFGNVPQQIIDGKAVIKVDEWMEDVDNLLSFMYGVQKSVDTVGAVGQ